jgi:hypothetical protein
VFTIAGVNAVNPRTKADLGYLKQFTIWRTRLRTARATSRCRLLRRSSLGRVPERVGGSGGQRGLTHLGALSTTFRPNAVFHKTAIKLVSAKLVMPFSGEADYATDPDTGITVRYWRYSDGANDICTATAGMCSTARSAPIVASAPASAANRTGRGGLEVLQEVLDGLFGMGVGQSLSDQIVEIDTDLPANTRALVFATVPLTITLPEMPENGQRVQIKDMVGNLSTNTVSIPAVPSDIVLNTDSGDYVFVYIDSSASWVLVSQLTPDSELPIGDDEFFRLELALRLIPMFGGNLTPESAKAHMRATNRIRARFHVTVITPADDAVTL